MGLRHSSFRWLGSLLVVLLALGCEAGSRSPAEPPAPWNVLLISVDTLRPDHLSAYGYPRPTSPHLDAWIARRGQLFETAVTASPWTLPAHLSLFTGLRALTHGVNHTQPVPDNLTLLAEHFQRAGYQTAAFTGGGFLHPEFAFEQGFEQFEAWNGRRKAAEEIVSGVDGVVQLIQEQARETRPFFLFLHTYETHEPYRPRQPFFGQFSSLPSNLEVRLRQNPMTPETGREITKTPVLLDPERGIAGSIPSELEEITVDLYDSGIASMDHQLSRIWQALETTGRDDDTIVVFTSDHGELLGEHGVGGHSYYWDENLLIPLVIAVPGQPPTRHHRPWARLIDVAPTLLELCAIESTEQMDGRSLAPWLLGTAGATPTDEAWAYSSKPNSWLALRRPGMRYVLSTDPFLPRPRRSLFYDLRGDHPPTLSDATEPPPGLREVAAAQLDRWPPSHRLVIANREDRDLHFRIGGSAAPPVRVKNPHLDTPVLRYEGPTTLGTVPRQQTLEVYLEATTGSSLELSVWFSDQRTEPTRVAWVLTPEAFAGMALQAAEWTHLASLPAPGATHVLLSPHGEGARSTATELPTELRSQLEALGYVD